jgi:hypothetical protein
MPSFYSVFLGWFVAFLKMLYDSSTRIYLSVSKCIAWLTNATTNWEFAVDYSLAYKEPAAIDEAKNVILEMFPEAKLWENGETQKIIHAPGFTVRIKLLLDFPQGVLERNTTSLCLDFTDMNIPYRSSQKILMKKIAPLLERISDKLKPDWTKYTFRIRFDGTNPFFGLYIKKLPANQIVNFKCELFEIIGSEREIVTLGKRETIINTSSLSNLIALSQKYVSLSVSSTD